MKLEFFLQPLDKGYCLIYNGVALPYSSRTKAETNMLTKVHKLIKGKKVIKVTWEVDDGS